MHRAILALTLLVGAVVFSHAQEAEPEPGQADVDFKLNVSGTVSDIPLSDVIAITVESAKMVFLFDPKKVTGDTTLVGPREGFEVSKDDHPMMLQNMLEEFRLCYVQKGDVWVIVPQVEARTLAPKISVEELANAHPAHWAVVHVDLKSLEPNSAMGALRDLVTRHGGMVNPVQPNTLLICDRVDRLRELVRTALAMDKAATPVVTRYELPEGTSAFDASEALQQLFPAGRVATQTFAAAPAGNAVLARATPADQVQIAQAVAAMK